ncbi:hypothetical protein RDWZM_005888 [Blomia tropicalis]|uniref:Uncharacterized protein n=1 Tax=Blomia tropicalis TaxID=40697 RepID=A0A9Q0RNU8_BLOTA|nr:hypothetical protein RDWZM_005888 [Blomia tropicalis]
MPQSQALCAEMTIGETMDYFASLYQLGKSKFQLQKRTLSEVLQLPSDNHVVATLSGGQQKALSLALVFLHSPKLVILDEPTVGTDPLLGDQIWSYLRANCEQGLTVILVTHYILEASLANNVGMMRGGRLIEEGTPQSLYTKYNEQNLETIFIKICTDQTIKKAINNRTQSHHKNVVGLISYETNQDLINQNDSIKTEFDQQRTLYSSLLLLLWLLFILIRRNFQKFLNSKLTTIMLFSPIFCTLLMCIIFKVDKIMLPTAVYNEEIQPLYSVEMQKLAKQFQVHHLEYKQYRSLNEAIIAVQTGKALAAMWFDRNFSKAIQTRALGPQTHTKINDDYSNENWPTESTTTTIEPFSDQTTTIEINQTFTTETTETYSTFTETEIVQEVVYSENAQIPDFLLSGYMIAFLYLSQVTLASQLLIQERNDGFFDRAIVAGAKHWLMFTSHFITNFLLSFFQIALMFIIGFHWYSIPILGSYWLAYSIVVLQSASSIMTGLLISATCKENFSAFFIALSITLSQLFTSGAVFPIVSFDPLIKFMLDITPISTPVESLRNVMMRGWDLSHFRVVHGFVANIVTTFGFGLIALFFFIRRS